MLCSKTHGANDNVRFWKISTVSPTTLSVRLAGERVSSRKTAEQLESKAAPVAPPSNDDEAAQMIAALQFYSRGKKNQERYVLKAEY
ncbi:hypothetical protein LTR74_016748 [Friedmanniomyces endolithicus]|nr:hypothetical protein LTR74_016748 [Friedmanniomyces endolithicus]